MVAFQEVLCYLFQALMERVRLLRQRRIDFALN